MGRLKSTQWSVDDRVHSPVCCMRRYVAFHLFCRDILHLSTTPEGQSVESWEDKSSVENDLLKRCTVQAPCCVQERMIGLLELENNQPTTMHQKKTFNNAFVWEWHAFNNPYAHGYSYMIAKGVHENEYERIFANTSWTTCEFWCFSYYMTSLNRNGFRVTVIAIIVDTFIRTHNLIDCSKS